MRTDNRLLSGALLLLLKTASRLNRSWKKCAKTSWLSKSFFRRNETRRQVARNAISRRMKVKLTLKTSK